jgi:hypothetical protein
VNGPLEQLLRGLSPESMFYPPASRYYAVPVATMTLSDGRTVRYLRRRTLPDPDSMVTVVQYRVAADERLDNIAWQQLGDPLAAWRIADANVTLRMEALVEVAGRRVRITLPPGVAGGTGA